MLRTRVLPGFVAVAVAYFIYNLLALRSFNFVGDPGVGWHLASGEWIFTQRSVPRIDPFLSVARPWICDQWLSDLVFFLIAQLGGGIRTVAGLTLLSAFLLTTYLFTFYGLAAASVKRVGVGRIAQALAVLYAASVSLVHCILRAVILSFLLFALTQHLVMAQSRWRNAALVVVFVLWANLHPSFVLGLALVWIYLPRSLTPWLASLATLINPNGIKLHLSIFELGRSTYFMRLNSEWLYAGSGSIEEALWLVAIMLIACAEILHRRIHSKTLNRLPELVTIAIFAFGFLQSIRFLPYFGLVVAAPLARSIDFIFKRIGAHIGANARRIATSIERFEAERYLSLNLGCICGLIILVSAAMGQGVPLAASEFVPPKSIYPYGALDQLKGRTGVVAAPPDWGGFITWYSQGRLRAILDDRNSLLGEGPYRAFFEAIKSSESLHAYIGSEQVDYLVLPANSRAAAIARTSTYMHNEFTDELSSVYSK